LSRNKSDIHNELRYFKENGIRVKVIDLPTTMMDLPDGQKWVFEMVNNILIEVLGTIAEQERNTIRQRQAEGIAAAKEKRKKLGRPSLNFPIISKRFTPRGSRVRLPQRLQWSKREQKERAFTNSFRLWNIKRSTQGQQANQKIS